MSVRKSKSPKLHKNGYSYKENPIAYLENSDPNYDSRKHYRRNESGGKSFKSTKNTRKSNANSKNCDIMYKSLSSNNNKYQR